MRRTLVTTLVLASACSGSDSGTNPDPDVDQVEVSLTPTSLVIDVGETSNLVIAVSGGAQQASASWICLSREGLNNPILGGTRSVAVRRSGYEGLSER